MHPEVPAYESKDTQTGDHGGQNRRQAKQTVTPAMSQLGQEMKQQMIGGRRKFRSMMERRNHVMRGRKPSDPNGQHLIHPEGPQAFS